MFTLIHEKMVYGRRVEVLAECFATVIPDDINILDVGCGDGLVASKIIEKKKNVNIKGVDIVPRKRGYIDISMYDGEKLPFADNQFDAVIFSDVLHHASDAKKLLIEALRVSSKYIIIKDHLCGSPYDDLRLRMMDWVGNARHGVPLPYKYFSRAEWNSMFGELELKTDEWIENLDLYSFPLNLVFSKGLHFIALLEK